MKTSTLFLRIVGALFLAVLAHQIHAATATIDVTTWHQKISGFGCATAWSGTMTPTEADQLWDTVNGAGLSLNRMLIDRDGLGTDETNNAISATQRGAKAWGTPWFCKNGVATSNGYDTLYEKDFQEWADTLASMAIKMKAKGAPIYAISSGNEIDLGWTKYSQSALALWVGKYLGPTLAKKAPDTKVIGVEPCNWYGFDGYYNYFKNDPDAWKYSSILATHEYGGSPRAYPEIQAAGKEFWETEVFDPQTDQGEDVGMGSALRVSKIIHEALTIANMNAWHYWWKNPCHNCANGALWPEGSSTPTKRLWIMGNWSRYARPGFIRVEAPVEPTTGVYLTAFRDSALSRVVIVAANSNNNAVSQSVSIPTVTPKKVTPIITDGSRNLAVQASQNLTSGDFTYSLPSQSVTTLVFDMSDVAPVASLYNNIDYDAMEAQLPVGTYTSAQLVAKGVQDNSVSSMRVSSGLKVELFDGDNFQTPLGTFNADVSSFVPLGISDKVTSLRVSKVSTDGAAPCDIYQSGGTPCVAAHSTVRALYGAYSGNLYQVRRASDNTTKDIPVLAAGGAADASVQDKFCTGTTCTISKIYDQSEKVNHLTKAPTGGATSTQTEPDKEVDAAKWNIKVNGQSVYAAYFDQGMGYRNNSTSGIAIGDQPEGMYMVTSGTHYNGMCCFDYGNAETTNNDDGAGTMESIYFGNNTWWGKGSGDGPWVMADMENALLGGFDFSGNPTNISQTSEYVTAMLKGKSNWWAIKGGNSQSGAMTTMYDGIRPTQKDWTGAGYDPMRKQGAIILGIGGDNSNGAVGTFFEGAMTYGYPSEATDAAVQANIVAAGYGSKWNPDSVVSLYQNYNYDGLEAQLPVGTYTRAQLIAQGLTDNDASSMKVGKGLSVELFDGDNFQTLLGTYTGDQENFGNLGINDKVTSLRISRTASGIRNRGIATTGGLRWSQGVLLLPETEYFGSAQNKSGRLQIIDSRGRSRIVDVAGGRASTGPLPNGLYLARLLDGKSNASQSFVVLP